MKMQEEEARIIEQQKWEEINATEQVIASSEVVAEALSKPSTRLNSPEND